VVSVDKLEEMLGFIMEVRPGFWIYIIWLPNIYENTARLTFKWEIEHWTKGKHRCRKNTIYRVPRNMRCAESDQMTDLGDF
jgi:hypothetical protein